VLRCVLEEELAVDPLAHEAALHVGEAREDGVDRAALDLVAELVEAQHPFLAGAGRPSDRFGHRSSFR
jgi:hypothetical protein